MATKGTVANLLIGVQAEMGQLRGQLAKMEGSFKTSFNRIESQTKTFGRVRQTR